MNYTKGEWRARLAGGTLDYPYYVDTEERSIANIWGGSRDKGDAKANAHLIAAAPDMYETLNTLRNYYAAYKTCPFIGKVLASLAKAEGK